MTGLNKPEDYVLAIVMIDAESVDDGYVCNPFTRQPDIRALRLD